MEGWSWGGVEGKSKGVEGGSVRREVVDAVKQHHPAHKNNTDNSPYTQAGVKGKERADGMRRTSGRRK